MDASHWLTLGSFKRGFSLLQTVSVRGFGLGIWLGIVALSMWQQWNLTFGQDPEFLLANLAVLSVSLRIGQYWQRGRQHPDRRRSLLSLIVCLTFCAIIHPFWIDTLTTLIQQVPLSSLAGGLTKALIAIALSLAGWAVPGVLWSAIIAEWEKGSRESGSEIRRIAASLYFGLVLGLILSVIYLVPKLGLYPTVIASSLVACGVSFVLWFCSGEPVKSISLTDSEPRLGQMIRAGMLLCLGGLLACHIRLANQLLPHTSLVLPLQLAGAVCGLATGLWIAAFQQKNTARLSHGILCALISSCLFLGLHPQIVDFCLWMNATFTSVSELLVARTLLMMAIGFPFGLAFAWVADPLTSDVRPRLIGWTTPFCLGLGAATFALGGHVNLTALLAACTALLAVATELQSMSSLGSLRSWRMATATFCLAAITLALPMCRTCIDASRTAKMLYSTPTFFAYRSGWEPQYLSALDDIRMIDQREGQTGPLTLWRGHVAELYVREAGVPRAIVTKHSEIVPQFSPEVLQAVYSLVIADQPGRVLVMGLSGGVPLSTCLSFPIRELVCLEGDANLISFVRGPLARETGFDPLSDDRVTIRNIRPELAVMAKGDNDFDVVLSCPTASSMVDCAAEYTLEFYQRAARQLAKRGLFCQRFECVDYGPEPLQMVVKAMQSAFRKVIAIETSSGEFLLLAANEDDVFVPNELAARLEMSHVRAVLARSGLDWSVLMNQATFDHKALEEICEPPQVSANSTMNGLLAARSPMELMRWGNKLLEVQNLLTANRTSAAPPQIEAARQRSRIPGHQVPISRRSRLIEWLDELYVTKELLRRLEEVSTQQKIVSENPDEHWWKYRKELRKQLQERPRSAVQQVKAIEDKRKLHPEDVHRREYFLALGEAATRSQPTREQIAKVESYLEPYDPLLSYFARQETAEMLSRTEADPVRELMYRLYVIYFAPSVDGSVRNVAKAIVAVVKHPEAIPDDSVRFDTLNGLLQTLRVRWEIRQTMVENSSNKLIEDVDQSLLAVEKGLKVLDQVRAPAGVDSQEWQTRRQVIERLLLRPLRTYRAEVSARQVRGEAQGKAVIDEALGEDEFEQGDAGAQKADDAGTIRR